MGDTRPVAVELMRTLDEKFIANTIVFESARPAAGFIAEGAALRRGDGSLDRELSGGSSPEAPGGCRRCGSVSCPPRSG